MLVVAENLHATTPLLPELRRIDLSRSHIPKSNRKEQSQPKHGHSPIGFLTSPFGGKGYNSGRFVDNLDGGFHFIAMLPTGAAVSRTPNLAVEQQLRFRQTRRMLAFTGCQRCLQITFSIEGTADNIGSWSRQNSDVRNVSG